MAAAATAEPLAVGPNVGSAEPATGHGAEPRRARLFEPGGATLEDLIVKTWDRLVLEGGAECPVCRGWMSAADGCGSCRSELS